MSRNQRSRFITVLFALFSLLFMQLAVAGYVCPGIGPKVAEAVAMTEAGMPCAESMAMNMDDEQPNLCQAHCQADSQSSDTYQLPLLVAVDTLPSAPTLQVVMPLLYAMSLLPPHLRRTTAPPLAIRNCCFRL